MASILMRPAWNGIAGDPNAVDHELCRFDLTGNKIQRCLDVKVDDAGNMTSAGSITADAIIALTFDTNIAAAGVILSGITLAADGTDPNINIDITPKGTGEINLPKVDIDGGVIDGCTMATSDITVGAGKTLDVSGGTFTLADNQISGDKVEGGTIAGITIDALVVSTTLSVTGTSVFQNAVDSTTAYQWLDADGGIPVMNINTVNERVGIGTATPLYALDVRGDGRFRVMAKGTNSGILYAGNSTHGANIEIFRVYVASEVRMLENSVADLLVWQFGLGDGNKKLKLFGDNAADDARDRLELGYGDGTNDAGIIDVIDSDGSTKHNLVLLPTGGYLGVGETAPETLLEMTSTVPYYTAHNSTEENIEGGRECIWRGKGEKQDGTEHTLGQMQFSHDGTGDDYKADFILSVNQNGGADTLVEVLRIDSVGLMTVTGSLDVTTRISSGTTTLSAAGPTDNLDVSGVNTVYIDTSGGNVTLGGTVGGVDGQMLCIVVHDYTNNFTIEHNEGGGNQDFILHAQADETMTGEPGGWVFVNENGNHWHDCSHAKHV